MTDTIIYIIGWMTVVYVALLFLGFAITEYMVRRREYKELMDENEKFLLGEIQKMKKEQITEGSVIDKKGESDDKETI